MDIKILHRTNKYFPKNFLSLKDCPEFIFVLGDEKILNDFSIAIVGARKSSYESEVVAQKIASNLVLKEVNIISGLAVGIDKNAHLGAVKNAGKTIAVMGNGIDKIYPRENEYLARRIIKNGGAIISEYFPGMEPLPINLHKRNRLIAALAEGVVIIEAKRKSGSLITAGYAKEQGKKIFVIPGNVNDSNYEGSNQLLVDGATCIRNERDLLAHFKRLKNFNNYELGKTIKNVVPNNIIKNIPQELLAVYKLITKRGVDLQEICQKSEELTKDILTKLTLLEIQGFVRKRQGKFFKT